MNILEILAASALLMVDASSSAIHGAGKPLEQCGYDLVFADEFDDLSVSPWELHGKRWIAHTPWAGDFGDAQFSDPGRDGPFTIRNGHLEIRASRDHAGHWRSGLLAAADPSGAGSGVQYGYFETRMRLPPGPGTWPAFWLFSKKPRSEDSASVELDVIEYYGHDPSTYFSTWHTYAAHHDEKSNRGGQQQISVPAGSLVSDFHTYGVLVMPDEVTYYLDRKSVWSHPTPKELKTPLFPMVNLALGSGYPIDKTPDPSILDVDYVRIYKPSGDPAKGHCLPSPAEHAPVVEGK